MMQNLRHSQTNNNNENKLSKPITEVVLPEAVEW